MLLSGDLGLSAIWIIYLNLLHGDLGDYFYVWNDNFVKNFISSNKFFGSLKKNLYKWYHTLYSTTFFF